MDSILCGESFHWFYNDQKALQEIHRVLKPNCGILGLLWYVPDRSVLWIKNLEEICDPIYQRKKLINTYDECVTTPLLQTGGFTNKGSDLGSYSCSQEFDLNGVIERYKTKSVVASAEASEKQLLLEAIEQEMKRNEETKNKEKHIYKFVMKIHWLQKV